jgi:hypothetical protein
MVACGDKSPQHGWHDLFVSLCEILFLLLLRAFAPLREIHWSHPLAFDNRHLSGYGAVP